LPKKVDCEERERLTGIYLTAVGQNNEAAIAMPRQRFETSQGVLCLVTAVHPLW
jgi:hypothetical protein